MLIVYLGIYTFILALLWGFFIVAKIHAYKFKNFSSDIIKTTNFLLIFLIILSILGYTIIFFFSSDLVATSNSSSYFSEEVDY